MSAAPQSIDDIRALLHEFNRVPRTLLKRARMSAYYTPLLKPLLISMDDGAKNKLLEELAGIVWGNKSDDSYRPGADTERVQSEASRQYDIAGSPQIAGACADNQSG